MTKTRIEVALMGVLLMVPNVSNAFTARNGTVTDERTGLVWQQQDDGQTRTWKAAITYCETLTLASRSDWRLPNIKELESITDDSRVAHPSINPIFTGTQSSYYWSSTTCVPGIYSDWWVVDFEIGSVTSYGSNYNYVRCVRGGQ